MAVEKMNFEIINLFLANEKLDLNVLNIFYLDFLIKF